VIEIKPICKHDRFVEREYAFRSPLAPFFNHYWSADKVVAYVCAKPARAHLCGSQAGTEG